MKTGNLGILMFLAITLTTVVLHLPPIITTTKLAASPTTLIIINLNPLSTALTPSYLVCSRNRLVLIRILLQVHSMANRKPVQASATGSAASSSVEGGYIMIPVPSGEPPVPEIGPVQRWAQERNAVQEAMDTVISKKRVTNPVPTSLISAAQAPETPPMSASFQVGIPKSFGPPVQQQLQPILVQESPTTPPKPVPAVSSPEGSRNPQDGKVVVQVSHSKFVAQFDSQDNLKKQISDGQLQRTFPQGVSTVQVWSTCKCTFGKHKGKSYRQIFEDIVVDPSAVGRMEFKNPNYYTWLKAHKSTAAHEDLVNFLDAMILKKRLITHGLQLE